ncbi:hypothetical protein [Mucilaginibacter antarcticus]|uniref:hypothetical protein n=1 Tax=Mucilaginibacter antarcticus TaxID=1855725 RepID=UPI003624C6F3
MTKEFEITENSLKVKTIRLLNSVENEIPFESITSVITRYRETNNVLTLIAALGFICCACAIISHFFVSGGSTIEDIGIYSALFVSLVFLIGLTYTNNVNIKLLTGHSIHFLARSPNQVMVNQYIQKVFDQQKQYLIRRYIYADTDSSHEQLTTNLKWLWERNIINETEWHQLRQELLHKSSQDKIIGFKFNA